MLPGASEQVRCRRLVDAYRPERVYLFGSRARGEGGPDSDYDLLVVVDDSAPRERRSSRLAYDSLRGIGTAADVLVCPMPADDARREDVSAWLSKASLDLRAAEVELSSRPTHGVFAAPATSRNRAGPRRPTPLGSPSRLAAG